MNSALRFARWALLLFAAVSSLISLAGDRRSTASENINLPLWPAGEVPQARGDGPLDGPFLTTFLPPEGRRNGTAVVIAPGGSNIMLMYGGEGVEVAEELNRWGIAAFVLTYRLAPRYNDEARIADGKRALQWVRAHAADWKLKPDRIGFIGFSAGSHLGRLVAAASGSGDSQSADPVARVSSRPDFLVLVYGAGRTTPVENLKSFPPTFLIAAAKDTGAANASAQLFMDLNQAGAIAELHLYQRGRHGFGAALQSPEFSGWMPTLHHFLTQGGFAPSTK